MWARRSVKLPFISSNTSKKERELKVQKPEIYYFLCQLKAVFMFSVQKAIWLLLKLLTKIPRADTFVRRLTSIWFNKGFQPFVWHFGGWLSLWRGLLVNYFHPVVHAGITYFIALPSLKPKATFSSFPRALRWTLFLAIPLLWEKIFFKICNLSTLQTTIITAGRWEPKL